jgi:hypothetical protein
VQRIHQAAFITLVLAVASAALTIQRRSHSTETPLNRQDAVARQIEGAVEALNLYAVSDPPHRTADYKLIVSELPIPAYWHDRLNIHHAEFERWRGTVAIYVGQGHLMQSNYDADHPERCAVWAGSFVYGDPALIEQLRGCLP